MTGFASGSQVPLASCGAPLSSSRAIQNPARPAQRAAAASSQRARSIVIPELFHTRPRAGRARSGVRRERRAITVGELIARGAARLARARVIFGHGTDNALDESAALVLHALG